MNRHEIRVLTGKRTEPCLFQVGDIVRLKTGKSPQRVMQILQEKDRWELACLYLSSSEGYEEHIRRPRDQHDFVLLYGNPWIPTENPFETKETTMTDLYQVKDSKPEVRYGTKLTVNSQGHFVLEMKGENGKVETFKPEDLELVVPYTVQLVNLPPTEAGMHIQCEEGKLKVGDLLIHEGNGKMLRVAAVNTKNRSPKAGSYNFFKLAGERVTFGDSPDDI